MKKPPISGWSGAKDRSLFPLLRPSSRINTHPKSSLFRASCSILSRKNAVSTPPSPAVHCRNAIYSRYHSPERANAFADQKGRGERNALVVQSLARWLFLRMPQVLCSLEPTPTHFQSSIVNNDPSPGIAENPLWTNAQKEKRRRSIR